MEKNTELLKAFLGRYKNLLKRALIKKFEQKGRKLDFKAPLHDAPAPLIQESVPDN